MKPIGVYIWQRKTERPRGPPICIIGAFDCFGSYLGRPGTLSQEHPTSCSAYAKCAAAGLKEGACCPSKEAACDAKQETLKAGGTVFGVVGLLRRNLSQEESSRVTATELTVCSQGTMLDCCYSAMLPKPAPIPAGQSPSGTGHSQRLLPVIS